MSADYQEIIRLNQPISTFSAFTGANISESINGDTIFVGDSSKASDEGRVFVYRLIGDVWTFSQTLDPLDASTSLYTVGNAAHFGASVHVDGDYAVVGAPCFTVRNVANTDDISIGAVYVYKKINNVWEFFQLLRPSDVSSYVVDNTSIYGVSTAIYENRIVVLDTDYNSSNVSCIFVYEFIANTWQLVADDTLACFCLTGMRVVDIYGDVIVVGFPEGSPDLLNSPGDTGAIGIYKRGDDDTWAFFGSVTNPAPYSAADMFGFDVSIYENRIAVAGTSESFTDKLLRAWVLNLEGTLQASLQPTINPVFGTYDVIGSGIVIFKNDIFVPGITVTIDASGTPTAEIDSAILHFRYTSNNNTWKHTQNIYQAAPNNLNPIGFFSGEDCEGGLEAIYTPIDAHDRYLTAFGFDEEVIANFGAFGSFDAQPVVWEAQTAPENFLPPSRIDKTVTQFTCGLDKCDLIGLDDVDTEVYSLIPFIAVGDALCMDDDTIRTLACCLTGIITTHVANDCFTSCDGASLLPGPELAKEMTGIIRLSLEQISFETKEDFMAVRVVIPVWVSDTELVMKIYYFFVTNANPNNLPGEFGDTFILAMDLIKSCLESVTIIKGLPAEFGIANNNLLGCP